MVENASREGVTNMGLATETMTMELIPKLSPGLTLQRKMKPRVTRILIDLDLVGGAVHSLCSKKPWFP